LEDGEGLVTQNGFDVRQVPQREYRLMPTARKLAPER